MGRRHKFTEYGKPIERSLPGLNFILAIPLRFSISIEKNLENNFRDFCEKNDKKISDVLRNRLFNFFKVKSEYELLKTNEYIRDRVNAVSKEITDEMGLSKRGLSKWIKLEIKEMLKNDKTIKKD